MAVTGVWNQLALLGFPALALALLTLVGEGDRALQSAALIGLAIFVVSVAAFAVGLSTPALARRVGDFAARIMSWARRCIRRGRVSWDGERFVNFRNNANRLLGGAGTCSRWRRSRVS